MTLFLAWLALAVLLLMIVIEIAIVRARNRPKKVQLHRHARRQVLLEDRMHAALVGPRQQYGEVFASFMIWRQGRETRMELYANDPWLALNEFTRSLVVRHVWRALERMAGGSVVVVDQPPQEWSAAIDKTFDDRGIDPWGSGSGASQDSSGPQFIKNQ
jgi:hypothetical protein